jgi:hypothetical protein
MSVDFLGITRERVYSPGKVDADGAILDAVAAALRSTHRVAVVSGDDPLPDVAPPTIVFAMCQGPAALAALRRWEAAGVRVINSAAAIANTHRGRMIAAFATHGIAHPASRIVATDIAADTLPPWSDRGGVWLKRGDVHATEPEDVVHAPDRAAAAAALARMRARGIATALVQEHVAGDVVKFYAVRGLFFACFPPAGVTIGEPERAAMRALGETGAAALDLEVFGGDCVRDRNGNLWLIDLNDWPSYGACRFGASLAIASYLKAQAGPP